MTPYAARLVIRPRETAENPAENDALDGAPFEARWVEADGQMSRPFGLTPPLSRDDAADLRWYLERYHEFVGDGTRIRAQGIETRLERWGRDLFDAAFGNVEGMNVYRNLLQASKAGRPALLTFGTREPDILVQPWELLRDPRGPLAFRGVSIRRQLEGARPMETLELRLPLRLLLIVSRPTDSGFLDPRDRRRAGTAPQRRGGSRPMRPDPRRPGTPRRGRRALRGGARSRPAGRRPGGPGRLASAPGNPEPRAGRPAPQRLAAGEGTPAALPQQVAQAFLGLAQAVYAARACGGELPPEVAEALAHLAEQPEPLASAGAFLRSVAEGGSPAVPPGLPDPLPKIFGGLLASV